MHPWKRLRQAKIGSWWVLAVMVVGVIFLSGFEYKMVTASQQSAAMPELTPESTIPVITSSPVKSATPGVPPGKPKWPILGIDAGTDLYDYSGIAWIRARANHRRLPPAGYPCPSHRLPGRQRRAKAL